MGDVIEGMDTEIEHKNIELDFLEFKVGLPDCKVIEEMNKLGLNKISSKTKEDSLNILLNTLNIHDARGTCSPSENKHIKEQ